MLKSKRTRPTRRSLASYETRFAFTLREKAELSSIGRSTIYAAIARGDLKMRKLGGRSVVLAQDARAWLEGTAPADARSGAKAPEADADNNQKAA
jgi:predicted DNA-binding transcriptional regulator AlpA